MKHPRGHRCRQATGDPGNRPSEAVSFRFRRGRKHIPVEEEPSKYVHFDRKHFKDHWQKKIRGLTLGIPSRDLPKSNPGGPGP